MISALVNSTVSLPTKIVLDKSRHYSAEINSRYQNPSMEMQHQACIAVFEKVESAFPGEFQVAPETPHSVSSSSVHKPTVMPSTSTPVGCCVVTPAVPQAQPTSFPMHTSWHPTTLRHLLQCQPHIMPYLLIILLLQPIPSAYHQPHSYYPTPSHHHQPVYMSSPPPPPPAGYYQHHQSAPAPTIYYQAVAPQQPPPQAIITPAPTPCEPIYVSVAATPLNPIWTFLTFRFDNNKKCELTILNEHALTIFHMIFLLTHYLFHFLFYSMFFIVTFYLSFSGSYFGCWKTIHQICQCLLHSLVCDFSCIFLHFWCSMHFRCGPPWRR